MLQDSKPQSQQINHGIQIQDFPRRWFKDHAYSEEVAQTPDDVINTEKCKNYKILIANSKILNFDLIPNNVYLLIISTYLCLVLVELRHQPLPFLASIGSNLILDS